MPTGLPPRVWPLFAHSLRLNLMGAVALSVGAICRVAHAQSPTQPLPPIVVEGQKKVPPKAVPKAATAAPKASPLPVQAAVDPAATPPGGSLTVPTTTQIEAI